MPVPDLGYKRTESVGLLCRSRTDQTGPWSRGGEDQPGLALPSLARWRLPLLSCRLKGAAAGLHTAASAARSCLCNKCHVCILAHHLQWPVPRDQSSWGFLTCRVQKTFNERAQPTGFRSVPSIDPRGEQDMPPHQPPPRGDVGRRTAGARLRP